MSISDLPMIVIAPSMSDDDNDFHSDMLYFRALLNDIADLVFEKRYANPFPISLADELSAATDKLKAVRW
jgi:hypothetical protein